MRGEARVALPPEGATRAPTIASHGAGSDIMKRIAAPMVGGVVTSTILELIIYPSIYMLWRQKELKKQRAVSVEEA